MSIETVERFKTLDKQIHNTKIEAQEHIESVCCEYLDKRIQKILTDTNLVLTRSETYLLISGLTGTLEGCEDMAAFFNSIID